jgi:hypothetical protein
LCAGLSELEERLDKQQKNVTSIVEQTRNLGENIEAQLAAVEARTRRAGSGDPGTSNTTVKPPKFDRATFWTGLGNFGTVLVTTT